MKKDQVKDQKDRKIRRKKQSNPESVVLCGNIRLCFACCFIMGEPFQEKKKKKRGQTEKQQKLQYHAVVFFLQFLIKLLLLPALTPE